MRFRAIAAALLLSLGQASTACGGSAQAPPTERQIIENWLLCEECSDGERQALVKLGQTAVSPLATALRNGPPQARRDEYQRNLSAKYRSMTEYARTHPEAPVPMTEADYIRRNMDNFVTLYQIRATGGLAAIGGPEATRELTQALTLPLPPDVLAAVRELLPKIR